MERTLARSAAALATVLHSWPGIALAESQGSAVPGLAAGALQMVLGLALVLALLLGSLWLLRRLSARGGAGAGLMRVIAGVAVGPRERVVLVEVGESWLVLGVAPGQVSTLHQLPRAELPASDVGAASSRNFRGWLDKALEHRNGPR